MRRDSHIGTELSTPLEAYVSLSELADEWAERTAADTARARQTSEGFSRALSTTVDALGQLRRETDPDAIFALAPQMLCETRLFDRVMVSRVRGSAWLPQALYGRDADGQAVLEIDGVVESLQIPLASPLVEAEVVRRRLPVLVTGAQDEPRTHRPLIERTGTRDYVVAPIVANAVVVGLLHADSPRRREPLTALDRDLVRLFADGVGLAIERAQLSERSDQQRKRVEEACEAVFQSVSPLTDGLSLDLRSRNVAVSPRPSSASDLGRRNEARDLGRLAALTAREREVLALMASGATNTQLADRLTVAESTVKSHVKHILHKLGTANRAAAIACFLRESRSDERRPR
ncbi:MULTISPECIES: LuxR C-terminal-related transcriptional regulator [unclassified Mycolicibacterium]|uniref:LuxR C-terminal-related transcriptional regulator n=1 Tax=unclassified Mycolicibacterium TaxID=2636767 RepID=UPI00139686FE|nr:MULTISPECIES: LuxR C-terminal-related transcriptional regulator [unclassified Mycolicibacterium]